MSLISIKNLTFAYDGSYDNIFENVTVQIDTNWKLGFTGRNGRGKTTFLKLLIGEYRYEGSIATSVNFDYFPFEIEDLSAQTLKIINERTNDYEYWELCRELFLMEMEEEILYRPFETLSLGERTRIMLVMLFLKKNNFLLIDEPTNHLDVETRKILSQYLNRKKGFILVSHDRVFLDGTVDHILAINKSNIEVQRGNFSTWQTNKIYQDRCEMDENKKITKEVERLKLAALKTAGWSDSLEKTKVGLGHVDRGAIGHKSAKMMKRAKSIEVRRNRAISEKSKLLKNIETCEEIEIFHLKHFQKCLIKLSDFSCGYNGKSAFKNLNLEINQGDRLAIVGGNGSGKSTLVKGIIGDVEPLSGSVKLASGLKVSYVSQDTSFLSGEVQDYALKCGVEPSLFLSILRKLDFDRIQFEKDMSQYSAGQKKKVLLARSICERAHLYIWDEPLNYIDVLSRIQIEEMVKSYKPTMIIVEHDSSFLDSVATARVEL